MDEMNKENAPNETEEAEISKTEYIVKFILTFIALCALFVGTCVPVGVVGILLGEFIGIGVAMILFSIGFMIFLKRLIKNSKKKTTKSAAVLAFIILGLACISMAIEAYEDISYHLERQHKIHQNQTNRK